jgi:hypothetical protein
VTEAPVAASGRWGRSPFAAGWGTAVRHGLLAFGAALGLAESLALVTWALGRIGLTFGQALELGGLYLGAIHRIPLRLQGTGLDVSQLTAGQASLGSLRIDVALVPLFGTALAAWLLWRGGRAVADRTGGGLLARALHGTKVAPVYSVLVLLVVLTVGIETPIPGWSIVDGSLRLSAVAGWASVLPFLLAVLVGGAGGLASRPMGDRARMVGAALAGGWWALVIGLGLSFGGLFAAGVVRPEGAEALLTPSTGRYYRAIFRAPGTGVVLLGHHLALAPNEAVWVLVPAMGGCTGAFPDAGEPERFLCYGRFPREVAAPASVVPPPGTAAPVPQTRFDLAPLGYFLFPLVPAIAAFLGGRRAARLVDAERFRDAVLIGAASGALFGVLVLVVAWFGSLSVSGGVRLDGVLDLSGGVRVGPGLVGSWLLGTVWGIGGCVAGAAVTARRLYRSSAARA